MTLSNEVRKQLALYTESKQDINAFRDWLAPVLRDAHKSDAETESLVHAIQWEFSDFARGVVPTEASLKGRLAELISPEKAVVVANPPQSQNCVGVVRQEVIVKTKTKSGMLVMAAGSSGVYNTTVAAFEKPTRNESPSFTLTLSLQPLNA